MTASGPFQETGGHRPPLQKTGTSPVLLVICPNLAIDRILEITDFQAGKVQRAPTPVMQPGGKGSNVARVFRQLGGHVVITGFTGKRNNDAVAEPLRRAGIHVDVVEAYAGDTRTCTIICDPSGRSHPTVINEETPAIEPRAVSGLLSVIRKWMRRCDAVLTTGSLSTGLPNDFYARIIEHARLLGHLTAIDATGDALRFGLLARPDFMKPNRDEFNALTRRTHTVLNLPQHTVVTFGSAGAVLIREGKCLYASAAEVAAVNPIGAGDTFVAAYLSQLLKRREPRECLAFATAAAASDTSTILPGRIQTSVLNALKKTVELRFL